MLAKLIKSVRRAIWERVYPKHYWHMRHFDRRFALSWNEGRAVASWRGTPVAVSLRPADIPARRAGLTIVASGPSLIATPPQAWLGRDLVCVNGSILWARQHGVRPHLYVVTDPGFARRQVDLIRLAADTADVVCVTTRCLFEILRQDPELFLCKRLLILEHINQPFGRSLYTHDELHGRDRVLIDRERHYQNRYIIGISTDLKLGIFAGGTVVLAAAQIGIALGYRQIDFVGLDMKQAAGRTRFYDERRPEPSYIDRNFEGLILPSFVQLRRYCDAHGIELRNWSPDSAIPRSLVPAAVSGAELAMSAE
jgi:Kdo-III transferase WaaZ